VKVKIKREGKEKKRKKKQRAKKKEREEREGKPIIQSPLSNAGERSTLTLVMTVLRMVDGREKPLSYA
jgi:hypothetical protein